MIIRIVLTILMASFSMAACSPNPSPDLNSGIEGTILEGPMCPGPVQVGNNTCPDQPYQATIDILNTDKVQVTQVHSDASGNFKVDLAPGTYVLHPIPGTPLPIAADQTVEVLAGQYTQVTINYDTGMR